MLKKTLSYYIPLLLDNKGHKLQWVVCNLLGDLDFTIENNF